MQGRVEGEDIDVIFQVFQQLVELLRAAAAVGEDLRLISDAPRRPRLDVPQIHALLLRGGGETRTGSGEMEQWVRRAGSRSVRSPERAAEL